MKQPDQAAEDGADTIRRYDEGMQMLTKIAVFSKLSYQTK